MWKMGILCKRSCSSPKGHSQPQTKRPSRLPNRKKKPSAARQYEWGHYGSDRAALEQDLLERVESYQQQFSVKVAQIEAPGLYKYYSTQRPVDIGTFPKPAGNAPDEIENYDKRVLVEGGAFLAWGHLTYTKPLTEKQAADYELRPAPEVSGLLREGRPRPIAEQMKEAATNTALRSSWRRLQARNTPSLIYPLMSS